MLVHIAYLGPDSIQRPPPEAWSNTELAVDLLQVFSRSEKVIDLLRHLPYVRPSLGVERYEIYVEIQAISFLRDVDLLKGLTAESCHGTELSDWLLMPYPADWPPGFISLTHGRDATCWVIDTEEGMKLIMN